MSTPRNDALARLIAPQLVGAMDVETAQDLLDSVEQLAVHKATARLVERCQQHGHLSTVDVMLLLSEGGALPAPEEPAWWPPVQDAVTDPGSVTVTTPLPPFGTDDDRAQ